MMNDDAKCGFAAEGDGSTERQEQEQADMRVYSVCQGKTVHTITLLRLTICEVGGAWQNA